MLNKDWPEIPMSDNLKNNILSITTSLSLTLISYIFYRLITILLTNQDGKLISETAYTIVHILFLIIIPFICGYTCGNKLFENTNE